jgi:hypothetical protein
MSQIAAMKNATHKTKTAVARRFGPKLLLLVPKIACRDATGTALHSMINDEFVGQTSRQSFRPACDVDHRSLFRPLVISSSDRIVRYADRVSRDHCLRRLGWALNCSGRWDSLFRA